LNKGKKRQSKFAREHTYNRPDARPILSTSSTSSVPESIQETDNPGATPSSDTERIHKTTKIPDPPVFKGDRDEIEEWLAKMPNKLRVNHDHYPTEAAKLVYAEPIF
jgi:hypothetical protein